MDNNYLSDKNLLERIKKGDNKAFEIIFRRYYSRLKAYSITYLHDEQQANDLVQEIFIKFWSKRKSIYADSIEHLLFRMVRNQCFNYLRDQRVEENKKNKFMHERMKEELLQLTVPGDIPLTIHEEELEKELELFLSSLSRKCRHVFTLSRKEGLSNQEIAKTMNFSIKNVEKYITRALKEFRSWQKKKNIF